MDGLLGSSNGIFSRMILLRKILFLEKILRAVSHLYRVNSCAAKGNSVPGPSSAL